MNLSPEVSQTSDSSSFCLRWMALKLPSATKLLMNKYLSLISQKRSERRERRGDKGVRICGVGCLPIRWQVDSLLRTGRTKQGHSAPLGVQIIQHPKPFPVLQISPLARHTSQLRIPAWNGVGIHGASQSSQLIVILVTAGSDGHGKP